MRTKRSSLIVETLEPRTLMAADLAATQVGGEPVPPFGQNEISVQMVVVAPETYNIETATSASRAVSGAISELEAAIIAFRASDSSNATQ